MPTRPAVLIAIVSVLVLIAPFSGDIFLPSMPSMALPRVGLSSGRVTLTVARTRRSTGATDPTRSERVDLDLPEPAGYLRTDAVP